MVITSRLALELQGKSVALIRQIQYTFACFLTFSTVTPILLKAANSLHINWTNLPGT